MTDSKTSTAVSGLSTTILFCTLLVLKVCGPLADVSWWWITSPIWAPIAFVLAVLIIGLMVVGGIKVFSR